MFVGCLLLVLPFAAFIVVRSRRLRLSTARSFSPHTVAAGSTASVALDAQNLASTWTIRARWRDMLPWPPGETIERDLRPIPPRLSRSSRSNFRRLEYDVRPPVRGVFEIGPLALEYGDPFGLVTGSVQTGDAEQLVVVPDAVTLPESGLSIAAGDGSARLIQRRATGNDDDLMTREYRIGDALRRVHWRASARHGELMVRQEEQRTYPEARLILDTRREGYEDVAHDQLEHEPESHSFEWAVRMIASLGVHLHRSGFLVHSVETGPKQIGEFGDANQWTGRDQDFLVSLASIRLTDPDDGALPGNDESGEAAKGPVFAVLGAPEVDTVKWLARQRRPYELAVAFVLGAQDTPAIDFIEQAFGVEPSLAPATEFLRSAGWIVVKVQLDDSPAAAWLSVVEETGVFHVAH